MATQRHSHSAADGVEKSEQRGETSRADDGGYYGYEIACPADYPYDEDLSRGLLGSSEDDFVNPAMLRDNARTSWAMLVFATFFFIAFLGMVVWQILIVKCKVTSLCELIDVSSMRNDDYRFQTYAFRLPSALIWSGLVAGSLGLVFATLYSYSVIRNPVGTPRMVEIATFIRQGASAFLFQQFCAMVLPVLALFILLGTGTNWRVAGCYIFGAVLSATTGYSGMSIATRGNVRTAAAAQDGLQNGLSVAFRSGAVMGLSVVSIGLAGVSASYLMFADVRALAGFSAGASTVALFARLGGGIYTKAADVGADLVSKVEVGIPEDDPRNPATIADNVGDNVGDVAGAGADLFESYVGSIIATAILGSSLPFFHRNPFAVCVFNHLAIDQQCGPFGYPEALSYATYICRKDELYTSYPVLTTWSSNSVFIGVPFLVAAVGVISSAICTLHVRVGTKANAQGEDKKKTISSLLWSLRINVLLGCMLVVAGSAGVCFGLFGANSEFQKVRGFSGANDLVRMDLDETRTLADACTPVFFNVSSGLEPNPVPQGGVTALRKYRPITPTGGRLGAANGTAWRLFLCILVGVALGLSVGFTTEFFTAVNYKPTEGVAAAGEFGAGSVIIRGLGIGMLSTVIPMVLIIAAIIGSHALFGPYGIGLASVGMLSTLGITMATDAYGPVADNAGGIAQMANLPSSVRATTDALDALGNTTAATGKGFSNGSAVLTAYALLAALVQDSGLAPSPRELVGSPTQPPSRFINVDASSLVSLADIYIIASMFLGVMLPFLFAGLLMLAVSRAAQAMIAEVRRQFQHIDGLREGRPGVRPQHVHCINISTQAAIIEMVLPASAAIFAPLIVGFGLGQKALIGMLVAAIGSGYLLGTMLSNAGGSWDNAKKLVESGHFGLRAGKGSDWHKAAVAGDTVGDPAKDVAGPSMNILIKLMTSFGLVSVSLMQPDKSSGWIGAIILAVAAVFVLLFTGWKRRRNKHASASARGAHNGSSGGSAHIGAPPKRVSPFYAAGTEVDPATVAAGSQMHEALAAAGSPTLPVEPRLLPGLSSRDTVDLGNARRAPTRLAMAAFGAADAGREMEAQFV